MTSANNPHIQKLSDIFTNIANLRETASMLERQRLAYAPKNSLNALRALEAATLSSQQTQYQSLAANHFDNALNAPNLDALTIRTLQVMQQDWLLNTALSPNEAATWQDIEQQGRKIHADCKATNDLKTATDWLEHVIDFKRHAGKKIARALALDTPYEGMLAHYAPGFTESQIMAHFKTITPAIRKILRANQSGAFNEKRFLGIPAEMQIQAFKTIMADMGFDFTRGDLVPTEYDPIEGGIPDYALALISHPSASKNWLVAQKSAIHEAWHGIYTQNLPKTPDKSPLNNDLGGIMQESQALLGEMIIGRSHAFSNYLARTANEIFGTNYAPAEIYAAKNQCGLTIERKTADEATYHLHIYMRVMLERRLMSGTLKPKNLNNAWNEASQRVLGLTPKTHAQGLLQDVHWFVGKIGLFPAYTMGHAIASQLMHTMRKESPLLDSKIVAGDYTGMKNWLAQNIYGRGRQLPLHILIETVTGQPFNSDFQIAHLQRRFAPHRQSYKPSLLHNR